MAEKAGKDTADVLEISGKPEVSETAEASNVDAYMEHLKKKYGRVTIESIGKDQASLEKAGKRMSGNDVVIAPNILEEMAGDAKKALYYEQKIDYFFNTVIPQGNAICAARGLVFEPCGVVVHEDGTVTYICGCSDSPERVAEVNRINAEKAKKKAEQQRQYQEQSAAAAQRRAMWERTAETAALEKTFSNIGDLLKTRMVSAPTITPEVSLPAGTNMFFLNM
ncbi:MAG: hypothetical protein K2O45_14300 [Oscillospiraceae bacterium]|nr:hypothetical protein [Oscillospiraceae bacterium]